MMMVMVVEGLGVGGEFRTLPGLGGWEDMEGGTKVRFVW